MFDHDSSAFLYIRSLRGTVHGVAQFLSKISLDDDKDYNRFLIDIGSCFKMDGGRGDGQNLYIYNLFHH